MPADYSMSPTSKGILAKWFSKGASGLPETVQGRRDFQARMVACQSELIRHHLDAGTLLPGRQKYALETLARLEGYA